LVKNYFFEDDNRKASNFGELMQAKSRVDWFGDPAKRKVRKHF